jgi:hypothetical protein
MAQPANDPDYELENKLKALSTDEATASETASQVSEPCSEITKAKRKKRVRQPREKQRQNRRFKHYLHSKGIDDLVSEVSDDGIIIITERNWDEPRMAEDVKLDWSYCRTGKPGEETDSRQPGNLEGIPGIKVFFRL